METVNNALAERIKIEAPAYELKIKPLKEASFIRFCAGWDLTCTFTAGPIILRSKVSVWRIYHTNCYVERIEHESTGVMQRTQKALKHGKIRYAEGFHDQPILEHDIYAVARYIGKHEKNALRHF